MTYKLSTASIGRLIGVHEDLQRVLYEAIGNSPHDFTITEGLRNQERQVQLFKEGKSRTLQSRHMTGHAVDIAIIKDGKASWDFQLYKEVAEHIKAVAILNNVPIIWGGDWRTLRDGPHFELNKRFYG